MDNLYWLVGHLLVDSILEAVGLTLVLGTFIAVPIFIYRRIKNGYWEWSFWTGSPKAMLREAHKASERYRDKHK